LVQNHCYRADEMQDMLDVAAEFGFHIRAFHHAVEAYKVRDLLAREGIGVATWADWWGAKMEVWDAVPQNLALLSQAGAGAVVPSDFELGEPLRARALQAPHPARAPALPASDPALLPVEAAECTAIHGATGLDGKPASLVLRAGKISAGDGAGCRQIDARG